MYVNTNYTLLYEYMYAKNTGKYRKKKNVKIIPLLVIYIRSAEITTSVTIPNVNNATIIN